MLRFVFILFSLIGLHCNQVLGDNFHKCLNNDECKPNSLCDKNTGSCKCNSGYLMLILDQSYECVPPAESVGSPCRKDVECEHTLGIESECDYRNQCNCLETARFVEDKNYCFKIARLNEYCIANENCKPNFPDDEVFCTNNKCTCGLKRHPNADGRCVLMPKLGEPCGVDDQCVGMNAVCRIVCQCRTGYVIRDDGTKCLPAASELFNPCIQDSQCNMYLKDTECLRGQCVCREGYHAYNNNCYVPKAIGSICRSKAECITSLDLEHRVDCVNSVCLCNKGLDALTCGDISGTNKRTSNSPYLIAMIISVFLFIVI